ncbi:MAG: hypothetical protein HGA19_14225 [Oscillochloris sp.]|nr:hypothetical protein [Oscillochloris sp.]
MSKEIQPEPLFERAPRADLRYCAEIAPIPRLLVRVDRTGTVFIRGQREEIERLIGQLRSQGLIVAVDYLSLCG